MSNVSFEELTMRDDFEYQVYVSRQLRKTSEIFSLDQSQIISGVIKKQGNKIYLQVNGSLLNGDDAESGGIPIYEELGTEENFGTLYASSWDNLTHFIIRRYRGINWSQNLNYNVTSYGPNVDYLVTEMSIASQLMLKEKVEEANYYFDHIHSWFHLFNPNVEWKTNSKDLFEIKNINFEGVEFKIILQGNVWECGNLSKVERYAQSFIKVKFDKPQTRETVFNIGIQIRNFFQMILNREVGLYQIVLNKDESFEEKQLTPEDYRENYFISQSYLPKISVKENKSFEITYNSIQNRLNKIILNFFENKKLQDFVERFLIVKQYKMPIAPILLTISSGVESYLSDLTYEDGRIVKDFLKKLNVVFHGSIHSNEETENIVKIIKDNRDYYTHSDKQDRRLPEIELIPIVNQFIDTTNKFILNEVLLKTDWLHGNKS